jgi:hypothetical protein
MHATSPSAWETSGQPRLPAFDRLVHDDQTAAAMELCLGPTTAGACLAEGDLLPSRMIPL